jgi:hypothetical protein
MGRFKSRRCLVAAALFAAAVPFALHAQEQALGTFNGRVDKEVRITMQGGQVSSNTLSGQELRTRYRVTSPLPQQEGTVRVAVNAGRGDVSVIQQPTAANGYTAVVRIFDRSGGADVYRLATYFTPSMDVRGNGMGMGRGRGGPGRGRFANLPVLHWAGDVDGAVELRWRGGNVQTRTLSGGQPRRVAITNTGDMTAFQNGTGGRDPQVTVNTRSSRGQIEVVQQPTAANRYTTVIRITDPAGGYGHYDFDAAVR